MKDYNEMASAVFRRRDEYIADRKRKTGIILKAGVPVCSLLLVSLLGILVWHGGRLPEIPATPSPDNSLVQDTEDKTENTLQGGAQNPPAVSEADPAPSDHGSQGESEHNGNTGNVPMVTDPMEQSSGGTQTQQPPTSEDTPKPTKPPQTPGNNNQESEDPEVPEATDGSSGGFNEGEEPFFPTPPPKPTEPVENEPMATEPMAPRPSTPSAWEGEGSSPGIDQVDPTVPVCTDPCTEPCTEQETTSPDVSHRDTAQVGAGFSLSRVSADSYCDEVWRMLPPHRDFVTKGVHQKRMTQK